MSHAEAGEAESRRLDIGLPVDQLRKPIRDVLSGASEVAELTLETVNRRGKPIVCRLSASPLKGDDGSRARRLPDDGERRRLSVANRSTTRVQAKLETFS